MTASANNIPTAGDKEVVRSCTWRQFQRGVAPLRSPVVMPPIPTEIVDNGRILSAKKPLSSKKGAGGDRRLARAEHRSSPFLQRGKWKYLLALSYARPIR